MDLGLKSGPRKVHLEWKSLLMLEFLELHCDEGKENLL